METWVFQIFLEFMFQIKIRFLVNVIEIEIDCNVLDFVFRFDESVTDLLVIPGLCLT